MRPKVNMQMILGRDLVEEPAIGAAMITEKDGYLFAWYRTGAKEYKGQWVMASVKDSRYHDWEDFALSGHTILVSFWAAMPRTTRPGP